MIRKLLFSLFLFIISLFSFAQTITRTITAAGAGTFTVPCGVTSLTVELWGGGGGSNISGISGGGGSGGAYAKYNYTVSGTSVPYTVGIAGSGGNTTNNGGSGGNSQFGSFTVVGGTGGVKGTFLGNGSGAAAVTTGNTAGFLTSFYGGAGGTSTSNTSGGGGSSAGSTSSGNSGGNGTGGAAVTNGGVGATGVGNNTNGNPGGSPGGGGSGARGNRSGGAGGAGQIRITYTLPTAITPITTGTSVCFGESGSLQASSSTFSGAWNAATDPIALRNKAEDEPHSGCGYAAGATRNYTATTFTVNTSGSYTFKMSENGSYDGLAYIYSGALIPGTCSGGTWIADDDDDGGAQTEPLMTANFTAGVTYTLISTTYGTTGTYSGDYIWTVTTPVSGGQIILTPTINWYANAAGGAVLGTGVSFNPVGVPGSGITTSTPAGTYKFYASYGDYCTRAETNFVINALAPSNSVGTYIPCIDNSQTTTTLNAGQYALVNIVQGYRYNFQVGDAFTASGVSENLSILDHSSSSLTPLVSANGPSGTSITNWLAPFSGQIKVVLSTGSCTNNGTTGVSGITFSVNSVGNSLDNQLAAGTADNRWRGHIYNWTSSTLPPGGAPSPASVDTTTPFSSTEYAGYYDETSESIAQDFGGEDVCFPVFSNGVQRASIRTQQFAVRYRMKSTKSGCYLVKIRTDDGARLYVDGVLVFERWGEQAPTTFDNLLINLTGNNNLVLDYYENGGGNIIEFSMTSFNASTNTIAATTPAVVCSGGTPGVIDGSSYQYVGTEINPTIKFQWQSTTTPSNAGSWADVTTGTGINSEDYTPAPITGNTVQNITYYRRNVSAAYNGTCVNSSTPVSITTNPTVTLTLSSGTSSQNICSGATITNIVYTWGGGATDVTVSGLPTGLNAVKNSGAKTVTISGNATATVNYTVETVGQLSPCALVSLGGTINIISGPATPTATVTTQPTCANNTGTITVSSPVSGYGYSIDGLDYSNTNGIFPSLAPTTYNVTAKNISTGCISSAASVTINTATSKQWNGLVDTSWSNPANWTPNGVPVQTDCVVIPVTGKQPIIDGVGSNFYAHTVSINSGGALTVNSNKTLNLTNEVTVNAGGSLIFNNNSSLMQSNKNAVNSGNITYIRETSVRRYDYTYWSSPLTLGSNFTLHSMSPNTLADKYTSYDATGGSWAIHNGGGKTMIPGEGYSVRGPQNFDIVNPSIQTASFIGVPNNGDVPKTTVKDKFNLLGNPYPSAISTTQLITDTNIGTIYFWTHNTPPSNGGSGNKYKYASADYASINLSGPLASGGDPTGPTGFIAAGQGFFAAPTTNSITFTNSMRVGGSNDNFYKTAKTDGLERNRIWLNFTNAEGAFKQMLVGYIEGASNSWDQNYDAVGFNGNTYVDFYSINENTPLSIQGRALPFENSDVIPLGYKTTIAGDFKISIDHVDGLFNSQEVYLEDKKTGVIYDLKAGDYNFKTEIGTFKDRFTLRYTNKTLGTGDFENVKDGLLVSVKDKVIRITSSKENIKDVTVFDITGKLIFNKKKVGSTELSISNLQAADQVLLVKVILENNAEVTRKVIFK